MRRPAGLLAGALIAIAVLPALSATAAPAVSTTVLKTAGRVLFLAADGGRVAVATAATSTSCDRIVVWTPAKKTTSGFGTGTNCPPGGSTSGGEFLGELALAGTRLAWVEAYQGNLQDLVLKTRVLGKKKAKEVAFAENHSGAEGGVDGDYLGNLYGDGSLLAYNIWEVCTAYPPDWEVDPSYPMCEDVQAAGDEPEEVVRGQKLLRISAKGKGISVKSGTDSFGVVDVDAGRIATRQATGGITILGSAGGVLGTVPVPAGELAGAALSGTTLAVLRNGALEVYDAATGALEKTLPLAAGAELTDLQGDLAVYLAGTAVHVVDLQTGEDALFGTSPAGPVDAELEPGGLTYAYNVSGAKLGRVVFVPLATVVAQLAA